MKILGVVVEQLLKIMKIMILKIVVDNDYEVIDDFTSCNCNDYEITNDSKVKNPENPKKEIN